MRVWLQRGKRRLALADTPEILLLACEAGSLEGVKATPELLEMMGDRLQGWFEAEPIPGGWDIKHPSNPRLDPATPG